jgi:hypothetical protein
MSELPPSLAARPSRSRAAAVRAPPACATMAKPPERRSSSTHSSASASLRGRATTIPSQDTSGITRPTPSTHAARSPRRIASMHADLITADPPAPAIHTVSLPLGSPPPGNTLSSAVTPVATCGTVRSGNGTAFGKRASMIPRSSAMAVNTVLPVSVSPAPFLPRGHKTPGLHNAGGSSKNNNRTFTESQALRTSLPASETTPRMKTRGFEHRLREWARFHGERIFAETRDRAARAGWRTAVDRMLNGHSQS